MPYQKAMEFVNLLNQTQNKYVTNSATNMPVIVLNTKEEIKEDINEPKRLYTVTLIEEETALKLDK